MAHPPPATLPACNGVVRPTLAYRTIQQYQQFMPAGPNAYVAGGQFCAARERECVCVRERVRERENARRGQCVYVCNVVVMVVCLCLCSW